MVDEFERALPRPNRLELKNHLAARANAGACQVLGFSGKTDHGIGVRNKIPNETGARVGIQGDLQNVGRADLGGGVCRGGGQGDEVWDSEQAIETRGLRGVIHI